MNFAFIKVEALTLATGPTVGISQPIDIANLMSASKSFSTDERRIMLLRRIFPIWDGLEQ
jgi:hypothetical protein